ncbi:MAG TPA: O-antigen ligase family protein [Xanthobacteraceae bacterium]|jgi:O-antigen ligase
MIDKYSLMPILACIFAVIVAPLTLVGCDPGDAACLMATRPEPRIFWPLMAAISVVMALRNRSRVSFPPQIVCLLAYLAFAGASVLWALSPESSFIRFAQQLMVVMSIVLPAMLAAKTTDMLRALFICYALASFLNLFFVLWKPIDAKSALFGYPGYFAGKNYLGEFAAAAFLLSVNEIINSSVMRRATGFVVALIATALIIWSNSKTAFGLMFLAPATAWLVLTIRKTTRISSAIILFSIPLFYIVTSAVLGLSMNRLSYMLYGDSTFTGRTIIWDFASSEIARSPFFGWGYQSFWLIGPNAPSVVDAPGWVKAMPNAHNGYLDTKLELGYLGYFLLLIFIGATLHAIGRAADRNFSRSWMLLSLALFVILYNFLESLWMRGFEFLWVLFLVVVAETAREGRAFSPTRAAHGMKALPRAPGSSAWGLRLGRPRIGDRAEERALRPAQQA